jgi:hypothetical protein
VYSTWEVMALWDLYLASDSWWAVKTTWSVYGMIRDTGRLMDDSRFKRLARQHEKWLAVRHCAASAKEVFASFENLALSIRDRLIQTSH